MIKALVNRIQMMFSKGLVASVDDTDEIQLLKTLGLEGETQEGLERLQPYGFTSNPPQQSGCFIGFLSGNRDHGVVLNVDAGTHRKTGLKSGEVSVYSRYGSSVDLKTSNTVDVIANTVNLGANQFVYPVLLNTTAFDTAWSTYFAAAASAWAALAASPDLDPASKTACGTAAAAAGAMTLAPATKVNGI
jgi:phage baseplate assembly protein V